jgi:hypothetical protein
MTAALLILNDPPYGTERRYNALLRSTLVPNRRIVIQGCNFGDRAAVWRVPVHDGNAVVTGIVRHAEKPHTENAFIGGPLQPVGGQAWRFVLVLLRVIPSSNIHDARAVAVCCFSPAAGGSP